MDTNIAIRLKHFFEFANLTSSQFADNCGIARPTLSQILTGRNKKISDVLIGQIHNAYPKLSILWLLFGEGDMLVGTSSAVSDSGDNRDENEIFTNTNTVNDEEPAPYLVNYTGNTANCRNYQNVNPQQAPVQNRAEIITQPISNRKISHITVYYDDSTFETFYPKS